MNQHNANRIAIQRERVAIIEKVLEKMERVLRRARKKYAQEMDYLEALQAMETEGAEIGAK